MPPPNSVRLGAFRRLSVSVCPALGASRPTPLSATIRGLRHTVESILELLSAGMTIDEVLADYPDCASNLV
jgi:hypothetical protein